MMHQPAAIPVAAMPSATVLLIRGAPLEVLMVKRRARSVFASAWVFPGGGVESDDASEAWLPLVTGAAALSIEQRALRIAACREVYEETGVFPALVPGNAQAEQVTGESFMAMVRRLGARLPLDSLLPFGHWITPVGARRRFDTHFFVCAAPASARPKADGAEIVAVDWLVAAAVESHEAFADGKILFPTLMNLRRLAESPDAATALAVARTRAVVTVLPRVERRGADKVIVIAAEAGYALTEYPLAADDGLINNDHQTDKVEKK